jgi:hypothetical protein
MPVIISARLRSVPDTTVFTVLAVHLSISTESPQGNGVIHKFLKCPIWLKIGNLRHFILQKTDIELLIETI